MFEHEEQELLDLVDENDQVIGQVHRKDTSLLAKQPGHYIRAVELFLQRSDGSIYLPRRSTHKKIAPGGYDFSAAGHIMSGESYEAACIREIKEELGIDVTIDALALVATIPPTPQLFYFRKLYLLKTDEAPALSPEHTDFSWVQPNNLEQTIKNDIPTKEALYECAPLIANYLRENTR